MIPVDYDLGKRVLDTCTCECGGALALCWGGSWGIDSYVLKCPVDPSHDKVVPVKSLTKMWKDGEELPSFIKDSIERKHRREIMEQNNVKAMVVKQDADKLSTYVKARFPRDLVSPEAALNFAKWCIAHQLEPIRDCIPYMGNPYITVEWLDRQASSDDKFSGYTYKVFGQQDKESLDFDPKDLVVECQANFDGLDKPLVGLGVVTKIEREARTGGEIDELTAKGYRAPVVRLHPQTMLFKRARAAALKQHYHIPAPILEELPYTSVIEAEYHIVTETSPPKLKPKAQAKKAETAPVAEEKSPAEIVEGEGFNIDLQWLKESQNALKWTNETAKTFLVSQYKVSPQGTLEDVIRRLTREQAEGFVNEINSRLEKQQPGLF